MCGATGREAQSISYCARHFVMVKPEELLRGRPGWFYMDRQDLVVINTDIVYVISVASRPWPRLAAGCHLGKLAA